MANDKLKGRITGLIDLTEISAKSQAADAAINGSRMMRGYNKMMKAAGLNLHRAAYGSAYEAAYSHARRVAEDVSAHIARERSDAANDSAALMLKNEAALCNKMMDETFRAAASLVPPFADQIHFDLHNALIPALTFDYGFYQSQLERMYKVVHNSAQFSAAVLPELGQERIPMLPPRNTQERANPVAQFMASFQRQYDEAVKKAEEEDGLVVVFSRMPSGDQIVVKQVSSIDEHFLQVSGVDQVKQPRSFKANCAGVELTIEIVPIEEDREENNKDEDLVN